MKYLRFLFVVPLLALVACDDDGITVTPVEDRALVRFVNLAPQPATVDLRFIDRVENLPTFLGVAFRAHSGAGYHRVIPGSRHLRVFPNSTDPAVAQTRLVDNPGFSLPVNERFTLLLTREGTTHTLTRLQDPHPGAGTIPRAPAGQIAVRVIHGATHHQGAVDVYAVPVATATSGRPADWQTLAAHTFSNVAYLSQTAHVNVPVRGPAAGGAQRYMFVVTAAGSDTPLFQGTPNLPGALTTGGAAQTAGPSPGVTIQESVLTVVLAPEPSPTAIMLIDRTLDP